MGSPDRCRSKLFVSCDLVGSTHFKQTEAGWQKIFLSFYREFPQLLSDAEKRRATQDGESTSFQLWKAVGDELIFEVEVRSEIETSRTVRIWLDAMAAYEEQVLTERKLALKGGAFIATFPGPDSESTIPRDPGEEDSDEPVVVLNDKALRGTRAYKKYLYDYFGPSIDIGFRLFGLATRRNFILSNEVAWALGHAAHDAGASKKHENFHNTSDFAFLGSYPLKGVWNSREYPVFAIDREHEDPVHIALAGLNGRAVDALSVINVCHACSKDSNWPCTLYLPDATNEAFHVKPEDAMKPLLDSETDYDGAETQVPLDEGSALEQDSPLDSLPLDKAVEA